MVINLKTVAHSHPIQCLFSFVSKSPLLNCNPEDLARGGGEKKLFIASHSSHRGHEVSDKPTSHGKAWGSASCFKDSPVMKRGLGARPFLLEEWALLITTTDRGRSASERAGVIELEKRSHLNHTQSVVSADQRQGTKTEIINPSKRKKRKKKSAFGRSQQRDMCGIAHGETPTKTNGNKQEP